MADSSVNVDPLEPLLEEFALRCRSGRAPSVADYAASHPEHAARIAELFPAVAAMEELRADERAKREARARQEAPGEPPRQLGDFHILQEIGRGGMGIVYEAEQRSLGRPVAVKVLPAHSLLRGKALERFQREARTAGCLHHTSIVPVFGVGEQDGLHYYVMPLVRGVGLDEVLRELRAARDLTVAGTLRPSCARCPPSAPVAGTLRPSCARCPPSAVPPGASVAGTLRTRLVPDARCARCPPSAVPPGVTGWPPCDLGQLVRTLAAAKFATPAALRPVDAIPARSGLAAGPARAGWLAYGHAVARIGVQAAEALAYAHAQGTLHRDIKPSNLLLEEDGAVSVADFGLARAIDDSDLSRSGDLVGTASYMAPEQLRGTAEVRSDVYCLGLTLYELLTLRPAFDPGGRAAWLRTGQGPLEPLRPRKLSPGIP